MSPADEDYPGAPDFDDIFDDVEEIPPRPSKRGPVAIFLLGWLCLPVFVYLLGELHSPFYEMACVAMLAFVGLFIWAMIRVVRTF